MKKHFAIFLLLAAVGLLVYSNTFNASFQFDDSATIVENEAIRDVGDWGRIFLAHGTRSLTAWTFALNYHFGKLDVFGYHLVNILIHIFNAFLIYVLIILTYQTPAMRKVASKEYLTLIACCAPFLFLAHPLQTQTVTYITQRASSLAVLFYLSSLICFIKGRQKANFILLGMSLILCICAMFTKELSFTLPFMLFIYDIYFFSEDRNLKGKLLRHIPYFATLMIIPFVLFSESRQALIGIHWQLDPTRFDIKNIFTELNVLVSYIRLMIAPVHQNLDYDYPVAQSLFDGTTFVSLILIVGLLFSACKLFKNYRLFSFLIVWYFLTNVVEFAACAWVGKDYIFEHYTYLPMLSFAWLIPILVITLTKNRLASYVVCGVMITIFCIATFQRNKVWQTPLTLWSDVVKKSPNKARGYNNLGKAYDEINEDTRAMSYYEKSIQLNPKEASAYINLGSLYGERGDFPKAIEITDRGLFLDQSITKGYRNLGRFYEQIKDFSKSEMFYKEVIRRQPSDVVARVQLATVLLQLNKMTESIEVSEEILKLDSSVAQSYNNLGVAYGRLGQDEKAAKYFHQSLKLDPTLLSVYVNLARAALKRNDYKESVNYLKTYLKTDKNNPQVYVLLGFTYIQSGDYPKAAIQVKQLKKMNQPELAGYLIGLMK